MRFHDSGSLACQWPLQKKACWRSTEGLGLWSLSRCSCSTPAFGAHLLEKRLVGVTLLHFTQGPRRHGDQRAVTSKENITVTPSSLFARGAAAQQRRAARMPAKWRQP